ncbi:MAG: secretin N-terminal domain-containing protein [candidate division WOR-3 bacterium]
MVKRIFILSFVFLLSISVFSLGLLNDITVNTASGKTEIRFSLDKVANFTDFSITSPNMIVIDLIGIDNGLNGGYYKVNNGSGIISFEIIKDYETNFLRVMIETDDKYAYSKEYKGNDIVIQLNKTTNTDIPLWKASNAKPTSKEQSGGVTTKNSDFLISLDVENADVVTLLRGIADYVGVNLVISSSVTGRVTIHVKDVPWKDIFDMVTRLAGLTYQEYPNMIRVGTYKEFSSEQTAMQDALPLITTVYKLEFANPKVLQNSLRPVLSKRGIITIDERTNSIIVKDIQDVQNRIQSIIEDLDKKNLQVEIVVKVVEIQLNDSKELGISWTLNNVGINQVTIGGGIPGVDPSSMTAGTVTIGTTRDFGQLSARLDALEVVGKSKTVSNPRITTTNNTQANILGGKEFFLTTINTDGTVNYTKYTVGTILNVIPHVNSAEDITLEIEAELSTVTADAGGQPIINKTQAKTVQMVSDGETVVMGGFILTEDQRSESGIPILRAIPILGNLFKRDISTKNNKEVLIFITPHIIRDIK